MPKEWPQNSRFREILLEEFATTTKDPVYYPGSLQKRDSALSAYSGGNTNTRRRSSVLTSIPSIPLEELLEEDEKEVETQNDDVVLVECGTPGEDDFNGYALQEEAFGPVVAVVELPGGGSGADPVQYLQETAAPFCNDKSILFGTLSCTLLWPESIASDNGKEPSRDSRLLQAIASLQYGTVAVNSWSVFGYLAAMSGGVWGGHPRDSLRQSGYGYIGNHFLLEIEKQVIYGAPLTSAPLLDRKNPPPAIVHDCLHAVAISNSTLGAIMGIWKILALRGTQFVLPAFLNRWIFGSDRRYGAAL